MHWHFLLLLLLKMATFTKRLIDSILRLSLNFLRLQAPYRAIIPYAMSMSLSMNAMHILEFIGCISLSCLCFLGDMGYCCCFMTKQHLRSYQDQYRLVTVRTYGEFIVLPHLETRLLAPWLDIPHSHIILILRQPVIALPCFCRMPVSVLKVIDLTQLGFKLLRM